MPKGMARFVLLAIIVPLLTACQTAAVIRPPVTVTRYVYVRIDPSLTTDKPIPELRNDTGREALRVLRLRKRDLEMCYANLSAIRAIEGTEVP